MALISQPNLMQFGDQLGFCSILRWFGLFGLENPPHWLADDGSDGQNQPRSLREVHGMRRVRQQMRAWCAHLATRQSQGRSAGDLCVDGGGGEGGVIHFHMLYLVSQTLDDREKLRYKGSNDAVVARCWL